MRWNYRGRRAFGTNFHIIVRICRFWEKIMVQGEDKLKGSAQANLERNRQSFERKNRPIPIWRRALANWRQALAHKSSNQNLFPTWEAGGRKSKSGYLSLSPNSTPLPGGMEWFHYFAKQRKKMGTKLSWGDREEVLQLSEAIFRCVKWSHKDILKRSGLKMPRLSRRTARKPEFGWISDWCHSLSQ